MNSEDNPWNVEPGPKPSKQSEFVMEPSHRHVPQFLRCLAYAALVIMILTIIVIGVSALISAHHKPAEKKLELEQK